MLAADRKIYSTAPHLAFLHESQSCKWSHRGARLDEEGGVTAGSGFGQAGASQLAHCWVCQGLHPGVALPLPAKLAAVRKLAGAVPMSLVIQPLTCMRTNLPSHTGDALHLNSRWSNRGRWW